MRKFILVNIIASLLTWSDAFAQKLEFMAGNERIFVDAQWLKPFDKNYKWTLFSRSRATVDYEKNTNLFTGAYLNYTTKSEFGPTVVGRISSFSSGGDAGVHFFKRKEKFLIYALATAEIGTALSITWFSIMRYTPSISTKLNLYTSLELFTNYNTEGHMASIQRTRIGLEAATYQFGFGLNTSEYGKSFETTDTNLGLFISKQF